MKTVRRKFKDRFAPLVRDGRKRQTVRPTPKRAKDMPEPGDLFIAERWTGKPYRSKVEEIMRGEIMGVATCEVNFVTGRRPRPLLTINGRTLTRGAADGFAMADGFESALELVQWFQNEHGLPFQGIAIFWAIPNQQKTK
jgi:hypothetical protein